MDPEMKYARATHNDRSFMGRAKLPQIVQTALKELKDALQDLYGERLRGLYLYGSYARGTAHQDSDIDVLSVLAVAFKPGAEITRMSPVVSAICLHHDLLISLYPISPERLESRDSPFLETVRDDAVPL